LFKAPSCGWPKKFFEAHLPHNHQSKERMVLAVVIQDNNAQNLFVITYEIHFVVCFPSLLFAFCTDSSSQMIFFYEFHVMENFAVFVSNP
jgi:hypothetical protein